MPRDYGPNRTPLLGLAYGGDTGRNENWDKIDALLGKLAGDAGLLPPDPVPEEAQTQTQTQTEEPKPES